MTGPPRTCLKTAGAGQHGIDVGGWVAQGIVMNPQSPFDHYNGPVTWMDRSNQYMLNEVWLYAGKAANNDGEGLALGFRTDFLYGASARLTTSAGLEDHINKSGENLGLAIPNLYIDAAYNDLRMKIGHFISPVGYYTVGTYQNFFNTIPYTYQWGEPFTHTGILPAYQATDNLVIGTGFTRGWDNSSNYNPHMGYIGTATYANLLKQGDSLAYVQMYSEEPDTPTPVSARRLSRSTPVSRNSPVVTSKRWFIAVRSTPTASGPTSPRATLVTSPTR